MSDKNVADEIKNEDDDEADCGLDNDFLECDKASHSAIQHEKLNSSLDLIDESPISMHGVAKERRVQMCQKKIGKVLKKPCTYLC